LSKTKKVIGVHREAPFAPLLFQEDSKILREAALRLSELGMETDLTTIDQLQEDVPLPVAFLNMCEGVSSLEKLERFERQGSAVLNRPEAVRNCYRIRMISMLSEHALPFPKSLLINLSDRDPQGDLAGGIEINRRFWLKRGDVHCTQAGDVRLVTNAWEFEAGLKDLLGRGITRAVLQDHLEGDLVKFYAVRGRSFFKCYIQNPDGTKRPYPRDTALLQKISLRAAEVLGLDVYGGDFVVTSPRGPLLIDINAWPSFAPCAEEAAAEIAARVVQVLSAKVKT
jgi:hypothetical protein